MSITEDWSEPDLFKSDLISDVHVEEEECEKSFDSGNDIEDVTTPLLPEIYNRLMGFFFFQLQLKKGGREWDLTASCEEEWWPVVSVILCDFSILEVGAVGCFFFRNWLKLRTFQPVMQKARVVEPKTRRSFVDSHKTMWGCQSGGRDLDRLLDL